MEQPVGGNNNACKRSAQLQALHYDYPTLKKIFLSTPLAMLSQRQELFHLLSSDKPLEVLALLVLTLLVDGKGPSIGSSIVELLKVLPEDVREKVTAIMLVSSVDTICELSNQFHSNNYQRRQSAQRIGASLAHMCRHRNNPCLFLRVLISLFDVNNSDRWYTHLILVEAFKEWSFVDNNLFEECINTNKEKGKQKAGILIQKLNDSAKDCDIAVRYGILIALNNDKLQKFASYCLLPMAMKCTQSPQKSAWAIDTLAIASCLRKSGCVLAMRLGQVSDTISRSTSFVPLQVSEAIVRAKIFLEQSELIKSNLEMPQDAEYTQLLCKKLETQKSYLSHTAFPLNKAVLEIFNLEYTVAENLRGLKLQTPEPAVTHCPTQETNCSSSAVLKEQRILHSPLSKQKRPSSHPDSKRPSSPSPPPKLSRMSSPQPGPSSPKPSSESPFPPAPKCSGKEHDHERAILDALKSLVHSSMDFTASDIENLCQEVCAMLPSTNENLLAKCLIRTFIEVSGKEFEWPFIITCLMLTSSGWSSVVENVMQAMPSFVSTDGQAKSAAEQFGRIAAQLCLQMKQKQLLITFLTKVVFNQSPEFLSVCNSAINVWPEVVASNCAEDETSKALTLTLWKLKSPEQGSVVEESQCIQLANLHTISSP
ncbi:uncharacterized protein LOC132203180 isoform X2 [Neocloeon triangulifer]|uniref:uncharacterized protein LOC132203180 isoform X2 n=1 Tax=Neocloeon triangulifer TaxID=2078957 RepID=UPI00286F186F|nr:uncharacterized protein LOC132203180 isoform X2 [Neocloeon triangulifer]